MLHKITHGYFVQRYDEKNDEWIDQEFIAGDEAIWETPKGEEVDSEEIFGNEEPELNFAIETPRQKAEKTAIDAIIALFNRRNWYDDPRDKVDEILDILDSLKLMDT